MDLKAFTIDPAYLTSITIRKEWNTYTKDGQVPTAEELLLILQGEGARGITHTEDHPEFTRLREQLGQEGYIQIERGWWNGDRVLKPFSLNGYTFKVDEQFSSADALGVHFAVRARHP
jgi:hypothetical protein